MNRIPHQLAKARKRQLIVKEVAGELIVYDRESDRVHCLNSTAAFVWTHCDGRTSVATMAQLLENEIKVPVEQEIVLYALAQLHKAKLLDEYPVIAPNPGLSRRAVVRLGVTAALTVPLISSIVAPTAAQAASCLPSGASCASDSACCSNSCTDNGRGGFQCS